MRLARVEVKRFAGAPQVDTLEGKLARVVLFAPPLIMLGRVLHLYHSGTAFLGSMLLIAAASSWLLLGLTTKPGKRDAGAWAVGVTAVLGWGLCWSELMAHVPSAASCVLLLGLPAALLLALSGLRGVATREALTGIATVLALMTTVVACAVGLSTLAALCCILFGVAAAVWGASTRALVRTVAGSGVALFGVGVEVWQAIHADNLLRWASLSAVGVLLIVASAYLERNRARLGQLWQAPGHG